MSSLLTSHDKTCLAGDGLAEAGCPVSAGRYYISFLYDRSTVGAHFVLTSSASELLICVKDCVPCRGA